MKRVDGLLIQIMNSLSEYGDDENQGTDDEHDEHDVFRGRDACLVGVESPKPKLNSLCECLRARGRSLVGSVDSQVVASSCHNRPISLSKICEPTRRTPTSALKSADSDPCRADRVEFRIHRIANEPPDVEVSREFVGSEKGRLHSTTNSPIRSGSKPSSEPSRSQ